MSHRASSYSQDWGLIDCHWYRPVTDSCHSPSLGFVLSLGIVRRSMNFRSFLYRTARIVGDVDAVKKGTIGKRMARRAVGKVTGRVLGRPLR